MFAIPNGGYRTKATAGKMAAEGLKSWSVGYLFAPSQQGLSWAIYRMKWGKNKLTELQREFFEYATQQGYLCKVAYSAEQAIEIIDEYLGLTNG